MKSVAEMMSLEGRIALVTGGAGHIGTAICEALAENGANIAVIDIDRDNCQRTVQQIQKSYQVDAIACDCDLSNEKSIRDIPKRILTKFDSIDILVNCAAFTGTSKLEGWVSPFNQQSATTWRLALEINLTVPFILTQSCSDALSASKHGSVINISSIYGVVGPDLSLYAKTEMGNPAAYAASKGGLLQLTRWLATVLAPDIRVNAITPGGIFRQQPESFVKKYINKTPMKRMGTEEDIKGAAVYLASDLSSYVTGHNLIVDGGWTVW